MNQKSNNIISIFTDAATSPQQGIAIGAFLIFSEEDKAQFAECNINARTDILSKKIIYHTYASNKSTWSEIKTVIEALNYVQNFLQPGIAIELFTDCKSVCDLLGKRKKKLEENKFITKSGKILQHAILYQELFTLTEKFQIQVFKIKGHQAKSNNLTLDEKIFSVLDKLSRKKMREVLEQPTK